MEKITEKGAEAIKQHKKSWEEFPIEEGCQQQTLTWEEEPVLTLDLCYPKLPEDSPGLRRVGRYYERVAQRWMARWQGLLLTRAVTAAAAAREASRPFRPWTATLAYTITCQERGLLSLYLDACEDTGGGHGLIVRRGDVWELPSGTPRSLRSFFPPGCRWRRLALEEAARQIEARTATGEYQFDRDWPRKLETRFDPDRFYLTPVGPVLFYPLYALAPYVEGIPTFPLGGIIPPLT